MAVVEKTVGYYNETTGEYIKDFSGQGFFYMDYDAFINKTDEVCYIPELFEDLYTYADFLKVAKGNEKLAQCLFKMVDWQCPETLFNDLLDSGEIDVDDNLLN
ncbi:MAG: hypothetical protein Pg6A_13200 [Termitinemataceae bacterium]|nr:MAG: hypothetical protein Pg6A_13200 [Termitinemataceae bacterium]